MSKIIAMVRDTFQCTQVWQRASSELRTRLKISLVEEVETTSNLKPQQTVNHRAFMSRTEQEKMECALKSVFQRLQDDSKMIKHSDRFSLVGRIS